MALEQLISTDKTSEGGKHKGIRFGSYQKLLRKKLRPGCPTRESREMTLHKGVLSDIDKEKEAGRGVRGTKSLHGRGPKNTSDLCAKLVIFSGERGKKREKSSANSGLKLKKRQTGFFPDIGGMPQKKENKVFGHRRRAAKRVSQGSTETAKGEVGRIGHER